MDTNNDKDIKTKLVVSPDTSQNTSPLSAENASGETLLNGRYMIEKELGRGGIGVVYLARDRQLHSRPVVIKVLLEEAMENSWVKKKFRQEIEALSRVDHPGIIGVLDVGEMPDGKPFLVMQFSEGVTLRELIAPEGMELAKVARIMRQIGQALNAAHDKGILHCDLKPENIMVQNLGEGDELIKIIDFGIAKVRDSQITSAGNATRVAGTVAYMAPEQVAGNPAPSSDIFALGVIAYEMVTGKRPFNPVTEYKILDSHREGVQTAPRQLCPSLPPAAEEAILKALAFEPEDRHARARDFTEALARALTSQANATGKISDKPTIAGVLLKTEENAGKTTSIASPRKRALLPTLIIAAILIAAGTISTLFWPSQESEIPPAPPAKPERSLNYWIMVEKDPRRYPDSEPFRLPGELIFSDGDSIQINIASPQSGHFYIINEGPELKAGLPDYNMLFPSPTANDGSELLDPNQIVKIPEQRGFVFDKEMGTEKLWFVWSSERVPELEAVRGVVNPKDKGVISNPDQIKAIDSFFKKHSETKPQVEKDEDKKQTVVKATGDVLIHLMKLEHH